MVLGRVCIDKKDFKKAESAFKASIKFDPKYPDALYGLALTYEKQGNKNMAVKYYSETLKYQPDFELASDALSKLKTK
jgi:Tfp pilus assembly protein PilF